MKAKLLIRTCVVVIALLGSMNWAGSTTRIADARSRSGPAPTIGRAGMDPQQGGDPRVLVDKSAVRVTLLDPVALEAVKRRLKGGSSPLDAAMTELLQDAEQAARVRPLSVTDKAALPPSGDKHDYLSLSRYWWPNPNTPDGLPYIHRDGEISPDVRKILDESSLANLERAVKTLSIAYYFKGDERFALRAAQSMRDWFLNPRTRMNPNLKYAEVIPGQTELGGGGIIQGRDLSWIVDCVGLLAGSNSWTSDDESGMRKWFDQYLDWLLTSDQGKDESSATNNHGSWYDVQVASAALFVGKTSLAQSVLQQTRSRRIARQIEPDGRQSLELTRTKSWDYSVFNLEALFRLAAIADNAGVDLWHFQTSDGRSIRRALDYLVPSALGRQNWPYKQITPIEPAALGPLLRQAAARFGDEYSKDLSLLAGSKSDQTLDALIYPAYQ